MNQSNADRQKAYRSRKRNAQQPENVTRVTPTVTPRVTVHERQCQVNNETRPKAEQHTVNTGPPKSFDELDTGEHNRVPLPGDEDYKGCVTTRASRDREDVVMEEMNTIPSG